MQWPSQRHWKGGGGGGWEWRREGPGRRQDFGCQSLFFFFFYWELPCFLERLPACRRPPQAKHVCQAAQQKINDKVSLLPSIPPSLHPALLSSSCSSVSGPYCDPHTSGGRDCTHPVQLALRIIGLDHTTLSSRLSSSAMKYYCSCMYYTVCFFFFYQLPAILWCLAFITIERHLLNMYYLSSTFSI